MLSTVGNFLNSKPTLRNLDATETTQVLLLPSFLRAETPFALSEVPTKFGFTPGFCQRNFRLLTFTKKTAINVAKVTFLLSARMSLTSVLTPIIGTSSLRSSSVIAIFAKIFSQVFTDTFL